MAVAAAGPNASRMNQPSRPRPAISASVNAPPRAHAGRSGTGESPDSLSDPADKARIRAYTLSQPRWYSLAHPITARLIRGAIGLALLVASLVVAENVFVNTGLHALLNLQPERVQITWSRAYMLVPGRVEVWDLGLRVQDEHAQWKIEADHAEGTIDLPALLEYRFSVRDLRGSGASLRLRQRLEAGTGSAAAGAKPTIEGLENPPSPSPEEAYGPPPRRFRIQLHDLLVEQVRELWIEDYRYVGEARLTAQLELLDKEWLEVPAAKLELLSGAVTLADQPIASDVVGQVDLAVKGLDPADLRGTDLLSAVTARVSLAAQVQDLRFLSFYLRKAAWLSLSGGEGPLELDVRIDEGRVLDGSRIGVNAHGVVARFLSYAVTGDANVRVAVAPVEGTPEAQLSVEFFDFAITRWRDEAAHVRGTGLRVEARTRSLTLTDPFETLAVKVEIPESTIPDARVYTSYLPRDLGFAFLAGTGTVRGEMHASTDDNRARGDLYLDATGVKAQMGAMRLGGNVSLHAHLAEGQLDVGEYDISGSRLDVRGAHVLDRSATTLAADDSRGWWAEVGLPSGHLAVGKPEFLDAKLTLRCRDSVPFVTIFSQATPLPGWVRGLLHVPKLSGEARIRLGDGLLVVPQLQLRGGATLVDLKLRRRGLLFQGALFARHLGVSFGLDLDGSTTTLHLLGSRAWYEAQPAP